jgi:hypothetical protein
LIVESKKVHGEDVEFSRQKTCGFQSRAIGERYSPSVASIALGLAGPKISFSPDGVRLQRFGLNDKRMPFVSDDKIAFLLSVVIVMF